MENLLYFQGGSGFIYNMIFHFWAELGTVLGGFLAHQLGSHIFGRGFTAMSPGWRSPLGMVNWLVVSTHLKNISQIGNLPQIGVKIKNI